MTLIEGGQKNTRPPETLKCSESKTWRPRTLQIYQPVYEKQDPPSLGGDYLDFLAGKKNLLFISDRMVLNEVWYIQP